MIDARDICSLTDFQRNTKEYIRGLKRTRRPKVLTVKGAAEIVVQDAAAYQDLVALAETARTIEAIRAGLKELRAGKGRPLSAALKDLERKYEGGR